MALRAAFKNTIFNVGDTVEVHQKIKEGDKTRTQVFRGVAISIKGHGENKSFTVRRIAAGAVGVERIWPFNSPWILRIKVVKKGKARRAKLYYLRKRTGKGAMRVKKGGRVDELEEVEGVGEEKLNKKRETRKHGKNGGAEKKDEKAESGKAGGEPSGKIPSKK